MRLFSAACALALAFASAGTAFADTMMKASPKPTSAAHDTMMKGSAMHGSAMHGNAMHGNAMHANNSMHGSSMHADSMKGHSSAMGSPSPKPRA